MRNFYVFLTLVYVTINSFFSIILSRKVVNLTEVRAATKESRKYKYRTEFIKVPLDHFDLLNPDTIKLRYLINDDYWNPENGDPILFYTGNEDSITTFVEHNGFMWETAPEINGLIIFAEHRYYGESQAYSNNEYFDPSIMIYLSVQQALEDFIYLIKYLRSTQTEINTSPVIAFGGSYGGMLSAWIRMKYPVIVQGALASSAPLLSFTGLMDCSYFERTLTDVFYKSSKLCPINVRRSWGEINSISKTDDGKKWLQTTMNTCQNIKSQVDVHLLKKYIQRKLSSAGMANYPYPTNFMGNLPGHPIDAFCKHLNIDLTGIELLSAVSSALKEWYNHTGDANCLDLNENDISGYLNRFSWMYQKCTQMVIPECSDGINDMFEKYTWNFTAVKEQCYLWLKTIPQPYAIIEEFDVNRVIHTTNIILSNGLLDPWHRAGILKNVSSETITIVLDKAAHHLDLRESNELDPTSVTYARNYYKTLFRKWIFEYKQHKIKLYANKLKNLINYNNLTYFNYLSTEN